MAAPKPQHLVSIPLASKRSALALARDVLDWEAQFGAPDTDTDSHCEVAVEDMKRWVELAKKALRTTNKEESC